MLPGREALITNHELGDSFLSLRLTFCGFNLTLARFDLTWYIYICLSFVIKMRKIGKTNSSNVEINYRKLGFQLSLIVKLRFNLNQLSVKEIRFLIKPNQTLQMKKRFFKKFLLNRLAVLLPAYLNKIFKKL